MSEANKDVVRRLEGAWASYEHDTAREIMGSTWEEHAQHLGSKPDIEDAVQSNEGVRMAFPDAIRTIEDIFSEGDKVVVRIRMQGTNKGGLPWFGIPANDAKVDCQWISIYRLADGKVVERWAQQDVPTLMQQLGAMPGM